MIVSRRDVLAGATALGLAGNASAATRAPGRFEPTWQSLSAGFKAPDWFRDAKFGIWAHWGPQGVGMAGDWYARKMYIQGDPFYERHVRDWGHPSKTGYIDMIGHWKAERWEPSKLLDLYQRAGARYFMALANHHDNFDTFASKHHAWNATRIGPKRDILGTWEKLVRQRGLKFGVSNHGSHAWHWFQTAYGYDPEGPLKGVRYDAHRLTAADGKGKDWEGLDPQQLYTGPNMVMPDGIDTIAAAKDWHQKNDRVWTEEAPVQNPAFTANWVARAKDLVDSYRPDMLYFDNLESLPLGQAGLDVTAYFYNRGLEWHGGKVEVVATAKQLPADKAGAVLEDVERGFYSAIADHPWQTDTCLGDWFYDDKILAEHRYKSARTVVHLLCDTVAKNGTLMLNVPMRPDGTIDEDEHQILTEIGDWIAVNGEAIYGTRPYKVFGEGPTRREGGMFGERNAKPFTAQDVRYTTKGKTLYAIALGKPETGVLKLTSVAGETVARVEMLGRKGPLKVEKADDALLVTLPPDIPPTTPAIALRLSLA